RIPERVAHAGLLLYGAFNRPARRDQQGDCDPGKQVESTAVVDQRAVGTREFVLMGRKEKGRKSKIRDGEEKESGHGGKIDECEKGSCGSQTGLMTKRH